MAVNVLKSMNNFTTLPIKLQCLERITATYLRIYAPVLQWLKLSWKENGTKDAVEQRVNFKSSLPFDGPLLECFYNFVKMAFEIIIGSFIKAHFSSAPRIYCFSSYLTDNNHHLHD